MKLGEIKVQAMRLMHIDRPIHADMVDELAYDDNYSDLYNGIPAAINRCFADLEARRFLPLGRAELTDSERSGRGRRFHYGGIEGLFEIARLVVDSGSYYDDNHPFSYEEEGVIRVEEFDSFAKYGVLYHKQIPRITDASGPDTEIALPDALAVAIPYYVKGDVFAVDEPSEAGEARNFYEATVAQYAEGLRVRQQGTVRTVYGC